MTYIGPYFPADRALLWPWFEAALSVLGPVAFTVLFLWLWRDDPFSKEAPTEVAQALAILGALGLVLQLIDRMNSIRQELCKRKWEFPFVPAFRPSLQRDWELYAVSGHLSTLLFMSVSLLISSRKEGFLMLGLGFGLYLALLIIWKLDLRDIYSNGEPDER